MKCSRGFEIASWILMPLALTSCCSEGDSGCKLNDSSMQDKAISGGVASDPNASSLFPAAQAAFHNNCLQCHAAFSNYTEAQWVSAGYVVAGQPNQSLIFQKIRGSASGGPENMPPGITISGSEILAVKQWITQLGAVTAPAPGGGTPGGTPNGTAADQRFSAALAVFVKPSTSTGKSCNTCHGVETTSVRYAGQVVPAFATFTREAQFVTSQLVTAGSSSSSWLYRALRGHGGDIASMPKSDPGAISNADAATLDAWITQIGN